MLTEKNHQPKVLSVKITSTDGKKKKSNFLKTKIEVSHKHVLSSETNSEGYILSTRKVIPDERSLKKEKETVRIKYK